MKTKAIDFIMFNVTDMPRAVSFYRDTLGMEYPFNEEGKSWTEFDSDPVSFALCHVPNNPGYAGGPAIALAVDDIHTAIAELKEKGVKILMHPEETSVCFMSFIEDPDGNRICIHQRKNGTAGKVARK
jgi:predicted enzyme related to lactoylglutathione lyase